MPYDVEKGTHKEKEVAANPLVQNGKKLVPSVTRVFSTSQEMYVYLQAYKQPPQGARPRASLFSRSSAFISVETKFLRPPPLRSFLVPPAGLELCLSTSALTSIVW
jgi:hypothetical protein